LSFASRPEPSTSTTGRQWFSLVILVAIAFVALGVGVVAVTLPKSCGGGAGAGYCADPTPNVTSPVEGVVISVDAAGLGDVRGFTLRPTNSAVSFGFVLGTLENPTEFPPSHLAEHQATSQPVRAYFRTENGIHTVYRLEDAAG
jgi:hypothetical protein